MPKEYSTAKTVLCVGCHHKFSLLDVSSYLFFARTHTCWSCYETLYQMTSTISSELPEKVTLGDLFKALFRVRFFK